MTRPLTLPWPDHLLTLGEWEALPDVDGARLEVSEGVLALSLLPRARHQHAVTRLSARLDELLPTALVTVPRVEVVVDEQPLTIRVPDLVFVRTALYERNPARVGASDVLLAAEILSDGTRRVDRVLKFSEYAEAGIPQYWILDLDQPTSLLSYVLVDGTYALSGEHTGAVPLDVAGHPVAIDLPALTRR